MGTRRSTSGRVNCKVPMVMALGVDSFSNNDSRRDDKWYIASTLNHLYISL